jgi:hypothetical protein
MAIRRLSEGTVNRIAAGEGKERSARRMSRSGGPAKATNARSISEGRATQTQ